MIHLVAAVIAALVGGAAATAAVVAFWPTIADALSHWLREHNLQRSALMSATVVLDRLSVRIRRQLRVRTQAYGLQVVSVDQLSIDQIDDPQVRALIASQRHVEIDALKH